VLDSPALPWTVALYSSVAGGLWLIVQPCHGPWLCILALSVDCG